MVKVLPVVVNVEGVCVIEGKALIGSVRWNEWTCHELVHELKLFRMREADTTGNSKWKWEPRYRTNGSIQCDRSFHV